VTGVVQTGPGVDAGAPWHYGDPLREQRELATGCGVVDRGHRDVLVVAGEDRLPWLHTICSQHVSGLADGDATEALVLSPHGHVEQHWQLTELAGTVWLDTEPGAAAGSLEYLTKMRFLSRVEPADDEHIHLVCHVCGSVSDAGPELVDALERQLRERRGFVLDRAHFAVFGRCADCAVSAEQPSASGAVPPRVARNNAPLGTRTRHSAEVSR
jgi:folate-binding Fe-S cluster repair protein YgfZ